MNLLWEVATLPDPLAGFMEGRKGKRRRKEREEKSREN